jgi:hypothetical protein
VLLSRVSNDPELHQKVAGVLVESNGVNNDLQGHYSEPASLFSCVICIFFAWWSLRMYCIFFMYIELSPDRKFPQDDFAPYSNHSHDWNPAVSKTGLVTLMPLSQESNLLLLCNVKVKFCVECASVTLLSCRDQVSCGTNIIFLYFYFQKRVQTLFKR